jgi:hypothetical protein
MNQIDMIHDVLRSGGKIDDHDAILYAQHHIAPFKKRIAELELALWYLVGDVEAYHRSHIPTAIEPPITREEIYHRDRAKALLAGYEPDQT